LRKKPIIPALGGVNSVLIVAPNKSISDGVVKTDMGRIHEVCDVRGEGCVESLSSRPIDGEHVLHRKMDVMDINNGNEST
jgi:hypothetical protein